MRALLLALAGHLGANRQPDSTAEAEYHRALIRRAALMAVAVVTCIAGCVMLWITGLVALWYTPWLVTYLLVSGLVLVIASVVTSLGAVISARDVRALRNESTHDGPDADAFPRSAAMRFAVNVLPAVTMLWWRGRLARSVARPR